MTLLMGHGLMAASEEPRVPVRHIREVLGEEDFGFAGLDKLSEPELARLSGMLFGWVAAAAPVDSAVNPPAPVPVAEFGSENLPKPARQTEAELKEIRSSIAGKFEGWDGKTRFMLGNGQEWRQTDRSTFVVNLSDPNVVIRKGQFGAYFLSVEGYNSRCKVVRVR
jgi:hypothetical protein